jgi:putative transposase
LNERIHSCPVCFYNTSRDIAAAQVIKNRGLELVSELGHSLEVKEIVCGLDVDAARKGGNVSLAGTGRSRKLKK